MDADRLVEDLTPPQREAVLHVEGPLLILAAAGSGKTRVITRRIARLVWTGVPPWSILALTFTNKAAGEMRERVGHLLSPGGQERPVRGLTVTTFHSLCARLLRRYAEVAGLPGLKPDFTIYDTADQTALMKKVITGLDMSTSNWAPRSVLSSISNAKNELKDAAAFSADAGDFYSKQIARIYTSYEKALRDANAVDFDDLLVLTARALRQSDVMREECRARWRHLLIDEYQDTNHAQFVIASLLAGEGDADKGPNVCVVGDPDQSIYGWRGADIGNILEFEERYPTARVITLGENFRSTAPILAAADTLIRHNKRRKHKDLFTSREGGDSIRAVVCRDERHEASLVADWLRLANEGEGDGDGEGVPWREMAVFYRTNALSRVMEDALRASGIPYVIARGTAFYQREEIKNALAYLRVVANPLDEVSLLRIVNTPTRGIGGATLQRLSGEAADRGVSLLEMMRGASGIGSLTGRAQNALKRFVEMLDEWTGQGTFMGSEVGGSLRELVERVIRESGLVEMYERQARTGKSEADEERLDNLWELVSSAAEFEAEYDPAEDPAAFPGEAAMEAGVGAEVPPLLAVLRAFLESVSLVADQDAVDAEGGAVTLMTLHAAKGLEFDTVAMIGLEEGLLPHGRARESESELEEERRLCFVGITRARRRLQISCAAYRTFRGMLERTIPSRFLDELPHEHVQRSDQADDGGVGDPSWDEGDVVSGSGAGRSMGVARQRAAASAEVKAFPPGSLVRHPQFGEGKVVSVSGGVDARAQVEFRQAGRKTLVLEYARLERIG